MDRRRALRVLGIGLGAAGGLFAIVGCDNKGSGGGDKPKEPVAAADSCEAKNPGDDNAKQMRKNLKYLEKAADPTKKCTLCAQFEPKKFGDCGGCKLFQGAVNPEGGCLSFAPKIATPPGVAPPAAPAAPTPTKG